MPFYPCSQFAGLFFLSGIKTPYHLSSLATQVFFYFLGKYWANSLSVVFNTLKTKEKTNVALSVDIVKVAGSSPITPTIYKAHK